jgi:hypothetical protein
LPPLFIDVLLFVVELGVVAPLVLGVVVLGADV